MYRDLDYCNPRNTRIYKIFHLYYRFLNYRDFYYWGTFFGPSHADNRGPLYFLISLLWDFPWLWIFYIIHNMYYTTIECKRIWSLDKVLIPSRRTQAPRKHTQQYNERSEQKTDGKKLGCVCTPNIFSIIRSTMFGERERKRETQFWQLFIFPPASCCTVRIDPPARKLPHLNCCCTSMKIKNP